MKHFWLHTLLGFGLLNITGCYTQLAIQNEFEEDEEPIFIPDPDPFPPPGPPPIPDPIPIYDPPEQPIKERVYKYRNPQTDRPSDKIDRDRIRNTGGRNNSGGRGGRR